MNDTTYENMERLGMAADTLDNLLHALNLPLPPAMHVAQLKAALPDLVKALREVYVAETGDNPWSTP
jgi:hypothetical protein